MTLHTENQVLSEQKISYPSFEGMSMIRNPNSNILYAPPAQEYKPIPDTIYNVKNVIQQLDIASKLTRVKEIATKVKEKVQEKPLPKFGYRAKFIFFFIGLVLNLVGRFIPQLSELITIEQVKEWYSVVMGIKENAKSVVKQVLLDYGRSVPFVGKFVKPFLYVCEFFI